MICENCKAGADLGARARNHSVTRRKPIALIGTVLRPKEIVRAVQVGDIAAFALTYSTTNTPVIKAVAQIHDMCTGCDCQHKPLAVEP